MTQTGGRNIQQRQPLVVKPVFTYEIPRRREQTSWRNWEAFKLKMTQRKKLPGSGKSSGIKFQG